jgi:hypothetical protein
VNHKDTEQKPVQPQNQSEAGAVTNEATPAMEDIVIETSDCNGRSVKKRFHGRWLVGDLRADDGSSDKDYWSIAETSSGSLLVIHSTFPYTNDELVVYESLAEMEGHVPKNIIAAAAAELGEEYIIDEQSGIDGQCGGGIRLRHSCLRQACR